MIETMCDRKKLQACPNRRILQQPALQTISDYLRRVRVEIAVNARRRFQFNIRIFSPLPNSNLKSQLLYFLLRQLYVSRRGRRRLNRLRNHTKQYRRRQPGTFSCPPQRSLHPWRSLPSMAAYSHQPKITGIIPANWSAAWNPRAANTGFTMDHERKIGLSESAQR